MWNALVKSQGDSSFPRDGHKAILNKLNSKGALSVNFNSIAIELNVPRDDFVTLRHGFKKAGSVLFDICLPGTRTF